MAKSKRQVAEGTLSAFFNTLSDELSGVVTADASKAFAVARLTERMRKRALFHKPQLESEALEGFIANNDFVHQRVLSLPPQMILDAREFIRGTLEGYTKAYDPESLQEVIVYQFLFDNWRFGPGASNGVLGTHAVDKIGQAMTTTAFASPLVRQLRKSNPYFSAFDCANEHGGFNVVEGSRLTTVPKNETTVRTIAIEPSGNMCLQLAAGMYLENALRRIGLDIRTQQPKNKAMAKRGSLTGGLATIDLKSASDLIGTDLVRLLFPSEWVGLMMQLRSPSTELPDGRRLELSMISTMGNGFTFPLMTLILCSLIYALRRSRGGPFRYIDWSDTAVFGDDIIVPVTEYEGLVVVLESAGFVVNTDKSYFAGPFRESCGGDYYLGYDVTPFYVKSLAETTDAYVALNQVLTWCGEHEVVLFRTIRFLRRYLGKVLLVPEWYGPNQGLLTAQVARRYSYLKIEVRKYRIYHANFFLMPLVCGGYVESGIGSDMFYSPRPKATTVKVRDARLPKGYLDGWDPCKRTQRVSSWVSLLVRLTDE